MTADQFTELIDFLGQKFAAIDERFRSIEQRLAALEVSHEAMRDDIRALAEGLAMTNERLDRFEAATNARFERLEGRLDRFEAETIARFDRLEGRFDRFAADTTVRFDRFEVDFGTVLLDHGGRIKALEDGLEQFLAKFARYEEAEALLIEAHSVLERERGTRDAVNRRNLERLVRLYDRCNSPDQSARYRALL